MTYEELLEKMIGEDDRIMVMTAENRAMLRNIPDRIPNNFVDVGISEQSLVGSAAGFALRGRVPVVHALAAFLTMRAFEFARTDIGQPSFPAKLVGFVPGFLSNANGFTHQAVEDVGLMAGIPNFCVFCPSDDTELLEALPAIIKDPRPFYIRYYDGHSSIEHTTPFEIGKAEILHEGDDVAIITYGFLVGEAQLAAELLAERGVNARVINLRTVKPMDEQAVLAAARETKMLVSLEDHFEHNGLYSMLCRLFIENGIAPKIMPYGLKDRWFKPGRMEEVLKYEKFRGTDITENIIAELNK